MKDRARSTGQGRHVDVQADRRRKKAAKVASVVESIVGPPNGRFALDAGCGAGFIAEALGLAGWKTVALDIDDFRAVRRSDFLLGSAEELPVASLQFSVVVSNHVVEHIEDPQQHLRELQRVLAPDGVAYVATPNRLWVMENHYRLPFLSWLPGPVADRYVRLTGRGTRFDVRPLSHSSLVRMTRRAGLIAEDVTYMTLTRTAEIEGGLMTRLAARAPQSMITALAWTAPTFAFALRRETRNRDR